jgi:hypothetical protein
LIFSVSGGVCGEGDSKKGRARKEQSGLRVAIIDGSIDEEIWQHGKEKVKFVQYQPHNGKASELKPPCKLRIAIRQSTSPHECMIPPPDKILREFGNAMTLEEMRIHSGFILDPYNGGMNAFTFL